MRVFELAHATVTIGDQQFDARDLVWTQPEIIMPAVMETPSRIFNVSVTFTVSGPFQFKRREQMLNLARYTRWPYTN